MTAAPFDPGWNDPPTFNYSNAPPPTKTKLNLNKRIAFPIQSSAKSDELPKVEKSGGLGGGLPLPFAKVQQTVIESNTVPVTSSLPLPPPPSMTNETKSCESNPESSSSSDLPQKTDDIGNSYDFVMKTLRESNMSLMSTDRSKVEEIDKRLNMLDAMWTDEKIDDKLKVLLVKSAEGSVYRYFFFKTFLNDVLVPQHCKRINFLQQLIYSELLLWIMDQIFALNGDLR